ncbi:hypothetical protein [Agaribacter marinus]|uniref:Transglutaminase-like superfamily protein n=1 Tax=Agaribacter marinus TaxID=1431249 RepID=A0AA37T295_9ALTE|nr:hypothetical protein [Agaribacter marinus]GLR72584.1 hypothetical protein GCM10007852_34920 [Agaribacter marinus]
MLITLTILAAFATQDAQASQLGFQKKSNVEGHTFSYRWFDGEKHYAIQFPLANATLNQLPNSPIRYNNDLLQQEIVAAIRRYAVDVSGEGIQVVIKRLGLNTEYQVRAPNDKVAKETLREIDELQDTVKAEFYEKNFFLTYTSPLGEKAIQHDFARYVHDSKDGLNSIVDAIKSIQENQKDYREFITIAMSWVQSIPYDDLRNRISSNGSGFASPKDLILQNRGDCDSKSTLLAAILKAYNEQIKLKMILLPKHALLGVSLRALPNEKTITSDSIPYVLLEPTGPAYYKIGEADDDSLMAIRNRQYRLASL